ncbi:hypothetical protein DYB32_001470 [Aphanomyces invadans]|uniref:Uncharacterized protein n=1 Tax=Aphanomyces invadans TaxID=157072 RepID=A0A3R6YEP6_9STRA|nr:hypothetical protein DYB32_001470 [Aphanomyces invadans]
MSTFRHRRRKSVLVPVNPNVYSNQRRGSEVSYMPKSSLAKVKPTVMARYSSDLLKVVEGGSSAFYSVHFEFATSPTHPIIVSPMTSAHTLRIYPSVIKFNPDNAHIPQFFRVSVLHETDDVHHMACGLKHTLALLDTGAVVSWGYGKSGALGHGNRENVDSPREVLSLRGMSVFQVDLKGKLCSWVACGGAHTMCLTDQYEVFAFGANTFGQLGVGDCRDRAYPVEVVFFRNVRVHHVVLGKFHSVRHEQSPAATCVMSEM